MKISAALWVGLLGVVAACGSQAASPSSSPFPPAKPADGTTATEPADPAASSAFACEQPEMFGPINISEAQKRERYGTNAQTFREAPTTKERPVEVCGVGASEQWLEGTACDDGSKAKSIERAGAAGRGGRCGTIIDLYDVECPEAHYDVFIDMYMCGPGESLF